MIIIVLEKVPARLRGELTRWMLEVSTGIFVGTLSAAVRDLLWEKCCAKRDTGHCVMAHRAPNEQGFTLRMDGDGSRRLVDFEGLQLIAWDTARSQKHLRRKTRHRPPKQP